MYTCLAGTAFNIHMPPLLRRTLLCEMILSRVDASAALTFTGKRLVLEVCFILFRFGCFSNFWGSCFIAGDPDRFTIFLLEPCDMLTFLDGVRNASFLARTHARTHARGAAKPTRFLVPPQY